jgi:hypothetical protein
VMTQARRDGKSILHPSFLVYPKILSDYMVNMR